MGTLIIVLSAVAFTFLGMAHKTSFKQAWYDLWDFEPKK